MSGTILEVMVHGLPDLVGSSMTRRLVKPSLS